jgi:protein-disulfide isomerase
MTARTRALTLPIALAIALALAAVFVKARPPQQLPAGAKLTEAKPRPAFSPEEKAKFLLWYDAQPKINVPIDAGGAKVLVVEFSDYQCSFCRQAYLEYKPILNKYVATGQVKFVLKHFPLEKECNAAMQGDLHTSACEAAAAVVMAQTKGTSDKLEAWLFENQAALSPATIKKAAADIGGVKDYDAQYSRALTLVRTDAGLGGMLGAKSTPTFVINGRLIAGVLPTPAFETAIEHELKRVP